MQTPSTRVAFKQLFYVPQPTFVIPIFRAPTTTSTAISTLKTTTNKIVSTILKHEQKQVDITTTTAPSHNMISQRIFENLIITNTIVAAFCIVLMVTLTGFLLFLLIPSLRRRWMGDKQDNERKLDDLPSLSRQPSFHHFTLGPSRLNPLFESMPSAAATTTQFGTLFQPHPTAATLLHPTIWTPMTSTTMMSSPVPPQPPPISSTSPPTPILTKPSIIKPPLPSHPPTTAQKSPRKR